jgi:hypothetical protein
MVGRYLVGEKDAGNRVKLSDVLRLPSTQVCSEAPEFPLECPLRDLSVEERGYWNIQRVRQPREHLKARQPPSFFDQADIVGAQPGRVSQALLREARALAQIQELRADRPEPCRNGLLRGEVSRSLPHAKAALGRRGSNARSGLRNVAKSPRLCQ